MGGAPIARKAPDSVKYGATAAGGVAFGGLFPLFLFDKFGIADLLKSGGSGTSAVYVFTVFAMVSFLILGVGSFFAKDDQLEFKKSALFYVVVLTFVSAFIIGFGYFVVTAYTRPTLDVKIAFDRYQDDVAKFTEFPLSPSVVYPKRLKLKGAEDKNDTVPLGSDGTIVVGLDALPDFERQYRAVSSAYITRLFDNQTMGQICAEDRFKSLEACANWNKNSGLTP